MINHMNDFTPRKTLYAGHTMRSRLEAGFAAWLDHMGAHWEYEPGAIGHATLGQYLPGFVLRDVSDLRAGRLVDVFVEVKRQGWWDGEPAPDQEFDDRSYNAADRMAKIVLDQFPDARFVVASPETPDNPTLCDCTELIPPVGLHWPTSCVLLPVRGGHVELLTNTCLAPMLWSGEWWKGIT